MDSKYVHTADFGDRRPPQMQGRIKVFLVMGGGRAALLQLPILRQAGLVIIIDVPHELAYLASVVGDMPNVRLFPLGAGQTAATMFQDASPELKRAVEDLAPMDATKGMGQRPLLGYRAAQLLIASPEFTEFLRQLPDMILYEAKGMPSGVELHAVGSLAGGVAAGGLILVVQALCLALLPLDVPIPVQFDLLGGVTFALLGPHIFQNSAATLWRFARLLRATPWHPLVAPTARIMELMPLTTDQQARNDELLVDGQLLHSWELEFLLARVQPNLVLSGPLGTFTLWTMSRFHRLDSEREVCPAVADIARMIIEQQMGDAVPVLTRIKNVDVRKQSTPLRREALDDIVAGMKGRPVNETMKLLRRPADTLTYELTVETDEGREYDLSRIRLDYAETPNTLVGMVDRIQLLASQRAALSAEAAQVEAEIAEIDDDLAASEEQFTATWNSMEKKSRRRLLNGTRKLQAQLQHQAETIRTLADERWPLAELQRALNIAVTELQTEERVLRDRIDRLMKSLESWCPSGDRSQPTPSCVYIRPVDSDFAGLLRLPNLSRPEQIRLLEEQVAGVTMTGLAAIVGSDSDRLEVLAKQIATATCPVNHPSLGGKAQSMEARRIIMLPPMPIEYRQRLVKLIQQSDRQSLVLFADSAQRGCTVVRYRISTPRTIADLFPGRLTADLRRAAGDAHKDLILPEGTDDLDPTSNPPWRDEQFTSNDTNGHEFVAGSSNGEAK